MSAREPIVLSDSDEEEEVVAPQQQPGQAIFANIRVEPAAVRAEAARIDAVAQAAPVVAAQPPAVTIRVSRIQERVAAHEALLAANNEREVLLYGDEPAAIRPALLDSLWAEAGQIALAASIALAAEPRETSTAVEPTRPRRAGARAAPSYDANIALIYEYTSPLLFNVSTTYDAGDEFGISDTFFFERERPTLAVDAPELATREFQHRFVFTPNRQDVALSLSPIVADGTPLATLDVAATQTRSYELSVKLLTDDATIMLDKLTELGKNPFVMPDLYLQLDAREAGNDVYFPRGEFPQTKLEYNELPALAAGRTRIPRYRVIEARASADLSARVVAESSKDTELHSGTGTATANASILAEELFYGAEHLDGIDEDTPTIKTELDNEPALTEAERAELAELQARQIAALADIEEALAEYDGNEYGILRAQSTGAIGSASPYYVIDDVRQYTFTNAVASIGVRLDRRVQRHATEKLRPFQETRFTYTRRLQTRAREPAEPADVQFDKTTELEQDVVEEEDVSGAGELDDDAIGDGEPATRNVLQTIANETGAREASRKRANQFVAVERTEQNEPATGAEVPTAQQPLRRMRPRLRAPESERDAPEDAATVEMSTSRALLTHFARVMQSRVKHKNDAAVVKRRKRGEAAGVEEEEMEDVEFQTEDERRQFAKERKEELRLELSRRPEDVAELKEGEEEEDADEDIDQGVEIVADSPAIFRFGVNSGYFGPVVGVPISGTQTSLLQRIEAAYAVKKDWRDAARLIFLVAVYFKLVPRLYTDEFPEPAVRWLVASLQLLRARVGVEQELFRASRRAHGTARLPAMLVVDVDDTIGRFAEGATGTETYTDSDLATIAIIYATHGLRPRNAQSIEDGAQIEAVLFDRPEEKNDAGLAAEAYPILDTYGASEDSVAEMLEIVGPMAAEQARLQFVALRNQPTKDLATAYDTLAATNAPRAALYLAQSLFPRIERGARNDVKFVYVPVPESARAPLAEVERATAFYLTLHSVYGRLDISLVLDLTAARVSDRRAVSERLLLGDCAAPVYVAAAQHYASEHFPPYGSRGELVFDTNEELADTFAVRRNDAINGAETTRALLSRDWLGGGRVFLRTARTVVEDVVGAVLDPLAGLERKVAAAAAVVPAGVVNLVPFYHVLAPRRVALWCDSAANRLAPARGVVRRREPVAQSGLTDTLRTTGIAIVRLLENSIGVDSDANLTALFADYTQIINRLGTALTTANLETVVHVVGNATSVDALIESALGAIVNGHLLVIDTNRLMLANQRTTMPFPGLNCDDEPNDEEGIELSDEERRTLANVWYTVAQELDWFSLGYLSIPHNNLRPIELAPVGDQPERYLTFAHTYRQLEQVGALRAAQLRFLIAREVGNVHIGRTMWFEETFIHNDPDGFGDLVRAELNRLAQWLRTGQRFAVIDYSGALGRLRVEDERVNFLSTQALRATGDPVRTLDQRNQALVDRVRALALVTQLATDDDEEVGIEVALPTANHKKVTADAMNVAQQLYLMLNPQQQFPPRRYASANVRLAQLQNLLGYTQAQLREINFDMVVARIEHPERDATIPPEWLDDVSETRAMMHAETKRRERLRAPANQNEIALAADAVRREIEKAHLPPLPIGPLTDATLERVSADVNDASIRRDAIINDFVERAKQTFGDTLEVPTNEEIVEIVDSVFADAPSPQLAMADDEAELREKLIELFPVATELAERRELAQAVDDARRTVAISAKTLRNMLHIIIEAAAELRNLASLQLAINSAQQLLAAQEQPEAVAQREALERADLRRVETANAADLREQIDEIAQEIVGAQFVARSRAAVDAYLRNRFSELGGGTYVRDLNARLAAVRRAVSDYEFLTTQPAERTRQAAPLGPLTPLQKLLARRRAAVSEEEEEADDSDEIGDYQDWRDVLRRLEDLYKAEVDRLTLTKLLQERQRTPTIDLPNGSIDTIYAGLLLPAAIERAKIALYTNAALRADGTYTLAYRGDVPQALRVAELVRRYCVANEVPLRRDEVNVFNEYGTLLPRMAADHQTWTTATLDSSLLTQPVAAMEADAARFINQRLALGSGVHHAQPYGCDLQLSALWLRVMRMYVQFHSTSAERETRAPEPAVGSLTELYKSTRERPYQRELTRTIAELPRASDRVQLYLALMFASPTQQLLTTLPAGVVSQLDRRVWAERNTTCFLPLIEEMRPIDARLLTSLVVGFDYSPLRRRERRDQFNPERFDEPDEPEEPVRDDGQLQRDGNDAVQRMDTNYIYRRGTAAKQALVDAYYRIVIDRMFEVQPSDVREFNARAKLKVPLVANQIEIFYQVLRASSSTDKRPAMLQQYQTFVAKTSFGQRAPTGFANTPIRRIQVPVAVARKQETTNDSYVSRAKMLSIYEKIIRDFRLNVRRAIYLRRLGIFEPVGNVHTESTGKQAFEFGNAEMGIGYADTERALLSAAIRHRIFQHEGGDATKILLLRLHREPNFLLVPRAALIGAMQMLALGPYATRQRILLRALQTVSIKLDASQHLWHDDTRVSAPRELAPTKPKLPPPLVGMTIDIDEDVVDELIKKAEQPPTAAAPTAAAPTAAAPPPPPPGEPAETRPSLVKQMELAASTTTNAERWQRLVERNIGRLLLGTAASAERVANFAALAGSIQAPTTASLFEYESSQLSTVRDDTEFARRMVEAVLKISIHMRVLFETKLDEGGNSEFFSEGALTSQRQSVREAVTAAALTEQEVNLFWLLARTEARRRARWRAVVTRRDTISDAELKNTISLTAEAGVHDEDDDDGAAGGAAKDVQLYSFWSGLFYAAVASALGRKPTERTTPRRIIQTYAERAPEAPDAQREGAAAFMRRQAALGKKARTEQRDVERYVPVYELLDILFQKPGKRILLEWANQYHQLTLLLASPLIARTFLRLRSMRGTRQAAGITLTSLGGPIYTHTDAFEPPDVEREANRTPARNVNIVHEFVPIATNPKAPHKYTIVNRVARGNIERAQMLGPLGPEAFVLDYTEPLSLDALVRRIVITPLDPGSEPMLRYEKPGVTSTTTTTTTMPTGEE